MVHKVMHQPNLSAALALRAPAVRDLFSDAASADTIGALGVKAPRSHFGALEFSFMSYPLSAKSRNCQHAPCA